MYVAGEFGRSPWLEDLPDVDARPLIADAACDVLIVGSGIAGTSTAYELASHGREVIVIDRGRIGAGITAQTTGHLISLLDEYYFELIIAYGEDAALRRYSRHVMAINRIEAICRDEGIDADFSRVDGYLFAADEKGRGELKKEHDACRKLGIAVAWSRRAPIGGAATGRCLRFPRQARFHPTKYLAGLARCIVAMGGRFHADTLCLHKAEVEEGVEVETANGAKIFAKALVLATHSPSSTVAVDAKVPMRTYAIAGRIGKGSVPDALVWDTLKAYHYVRIQPDWNDGDLLIVGGEDHRPSEEDNMATRLEALETWTRRHYGSFIAADYRWSGEVLEPGGFATFSGRAPGSRNIYANFADSGQGITKSVAGALTILPLLLA